MPRYRIEPNYQRKDFEDLVSLHNKVGRNASTRIGRFAGPFIAIVSVILILEAAVLLWLQRSLSLTSAGALVVGVGGLIYSFYRKRIQVNQTYKLNQKFLQRVVCFDDDGVHMEGEQFDANYQYDSIDAVYYWRDSYALYVDRTHALMLPVSAFVEGDPAEFAAFITEKTGLPVQTPADKKKKES